MEKSFSHKTKMLILNNPNSHLGKVYTEDELEHIASLCKKYNVLCLADEVFEWSVFPEFKHTRMCKFQIYLIAVFFTSLKLNMPKRHVNKYICTGLVK